MYKLLEICFSKYDRDIDIMENLFSIIVSKEIIELKFILMVNQGISNRMLQLLFRDAFHWLKLAFSKGRFLFTSFLFASVSFPRFMFSFML